MKSLKLFLNCQKIFLQSSEHNGQNSQNDNIWINLKQTLHLQRYPSAQKKSSLQFPILLKFDLKNNNKV